MSIEPLENLVRIRKLKQEAPDQAQIDGMIRSAKTRIEDLQVEGLSQEGKFLSAYGAAHSLALAALRWHGYRSDNRYIAFFSEGKLKKVGRGLIEDSLPK